MLGLGFRMLADQSDSSDPRRRNGRLSAHSDLEEADYAALPQALPCRTFFERYPEKVGPMGNVLITDEEELLPWLLVARPVPAKDAKKMGGCILYNPSLGDTPADGPKRRSQFYCITDPDDVVYGRAAYLPRTNESNLICAKQSLSSLSDYDTCSQQVLTDNSAESTGTPIHSEVTSSNFSESCRCIKNSITIQ